MSIFLNLLLNVFALLVVEYLIPGFEFETTQAAVVAAIAIGVVNMFIKPVIQVVALPLTIMTLGVAAFLINVLLLMGVANVVPGFVIDSFLTAVIASIVLALVQPFSTNSPDRINLL